jgi:hypothetical protein
MGDRGFRRIGGTGVAPFGIAFTIVEPGPARTGFGASKVSPPPMAVYDDTPAGAMRRAVAGGTFSLRGDVTRMARAMVEVAERSTAPKRLVLGSSSYTAIRSALSAWLAELDAQKDISFSTDSG